MDKYILETAKRLEMIVKGFVDKYGDRCEVQYMADLRQAIGVLEAIITKYTNNK